MGIMTVNKMVLRIEYSWDMISGVGELESDSQIGAGQCHDKIVISKHIRKRTMPTSFGHNLTRKSSSLT